MRLITREPWTLELIKYANCREQDGGSPGSMFTEERILAIFAQKPTEGTGETPHTSPPADIFVISCHNQQVFLASIFKNEFEPLWDLRLHVCTQAQWKNLPHSASIHLFQYSRQLCWPRFPRRLRTCVYACARRCVRVRKRGMALRQEDSEGLYSKVCLPTRVSFPFSTSLRFFLSIQKEFVVCFFRESEKKKTNNLLRI